MTILSTRRQGVECDESRCVHGVYLRHFTASCNTFTVTANERMRDAYHLLLLVLPHCVRRMRTWWHHTLAHGGRNRTQIQVRILAFAHVCHRLCRLIGKEFSICLVARCSLRHAPWSMFCEVWIYIITFLSIHAMPFTLSAQWWCSCLFIGRYYCECSATDNT